MGRLFKTLLPLLAAILACAAIQAQTVEQSKEEEQILELTPQGRSIYDEYTLGQQEEGAKIIYSYQHTQSFEAVQEEVSLTFDYPLENMENPYTITQVTAYVEASDGATTQAYVTANGIGERSISMQFVANNTSSLHYMIVLYGKQM